MNRQRCDKPMYSYPRLPVISVMLDPGAKMPERAHEIDAGMDVFAPDTMSNSAIYPGGSLTIDTGLHVQIPEGYVGLLKSKSGLNVNFGLVSEGVIDAGYTGSITVKLYNHSEGKYVIRPGDKISQLLIIRCETPDLKLVSSMRDTERGDNGFGSTGR